MKTRKKYITICTITLFIFRFFVDSSVSSEREILVTSISTNFWLYELAILNARQDGDSESVERISKNAVAFTFLLYINLEHLGKNDSEIKQLFISIKNDPFLQALSLGTNHDPLGIFDLYDSNGIIRSTPTQFNFSSQNLVSDRKKYEELVARFHKWASK